MRFLLSAALLALTIPAASAQGIQSGQAFQPVQAGRPALPPLGVSGGQPIQVRPVQPPPTVVNAGAAGANGDGVFTLDSYKAYILTVMQRRMACVQAAQTREAVQSCLPQKAQGAVPGLGQTASPGLGQTSYGGFPGDK